MVVVVVDADGKEKRVGRLYTEGEVQELVRLTLRLNTSCIQFSQSMEEVFKVAKAFGAIVSPPEKHRKKERVNEV